MSNCATVSRRGITFGGRFSTACGCGLTFGGRYQNVDRCTATSKGLPELLGVQSTPLLRCPLHFMPSLVCTACPSCALLLVNTPTTTTCACSACSYICVLLWVAIPYAALGSGVSAAAETDIPELFTDLGYFDPTPASLRIAFVFWQIEVALDVVHRHPKHPAKPVLRQPSVAAFFFLAEKPGTVNKQDIRRFQTIPVFCCLWEMGLRVLVGNRICESMRMCSYGDACSCFFWGGGRTYTVYP